MSNRTIVEFNHDYAGEIASDPDGFVRAVRAMLNNGINLHPSSAERREPLSRFGVTATVTAHHSEERRVIIGDYFDKAL